MAKGISARSGEKITAGHYVDISDSFHIYGSYAEEFKEFLNMVKKRPFEKRTWSTEFARPFFEEVKERLKNER